MEQTKKIVPILLKIFFSHLLREYTAITGNSDNTNIGVSFKYKVCPIFTKIIIAIRLIKKPTIDFSILVLLGLIKYSIMTEMIMPSISEIQKLVKQLVKISDIPILLKNARLK